MDAPSQEHILELLAEIYDSYISGLIWIFCPPHPEFCGSVVCALLFSKRKMNLETYSETDILGSILHY